MFVTPAFAQESGIDTGKGMLDETGIVWFDFHLLDVEGRGWNKTKAPYDRLPAELSEVSL